MVKPMVEKSPATRADARAQILISDGKFRGKNARCAGALAADQPVLVAIGKGRRAPGTRAKMAELAQCPAQV
jgi:hypothetical protein